MRHGDVIAVDQTKTVIIVIREATPSRSRTPIAATGHTYGSVRVANFQYTCVATDSFSSAESARRRSMFNSTKDTYRFHKANGRSRQGPVFAYSS